MSTAVGSGSQTRLTSNVALERPIPEGTEVTLTCSSDSSSDSGVLRILRRRGEGESIDGFEDLANFATRVVQISADRPDIAATFVVSRKDDGAVFICGDVENFGFQSHISAVSRTIRIQFNPRSLLLKSIPEGRMREDMSKVIVCQTDEGGANPAVNVTWRHLSPLGGIEALGEEMRTTSTHRISSSGSGRGFVTQSNLTVLAHRRLNGHRIECSVEKPERIALLRQSETLEVIFAPNSVHIHPSTTGGVSEGEVISLTCTVAVSHPPATVRWFEFPPGSEGGADSGQEITDLAQIDMTSGEYGGMLVDSTLRVSKTFRSNSLTEYRCVVNQAALKNPVVAEYKLNVLYPPTAEIVSLPNDPTEGQSVTLSCLTQGGMPDKSFSFSWWYAKDLKLPSTATQNGQPTTQQELSPALAKSLTSSLNTTVLAEHFSTHMTQIPGHMGRHLLLDAITIEESGWYGCQVVNAGGSAQSLHLLLINYAPRIHPSTKFIQYAQLGMKTEFVLTVEARPARAEFMWFWIDDTTLANKARSKILSQSSTSEIVRSRRSAAPLKAISTSIAPWINRVKQTSTAIGANRLTFTLAFREVVESDFGLYVCQVNHKAGNREFYFELKPQSDAKGINPNSIRITSEGRKVRVDFEPPNSQFYSRIVLRICLPSRVSANSVVDSGRRIRPSGELVFLRSIKDTSSASIDSSSVEIIGTTTTVSNDECGDYEVTFAELGIIQVELDRPIAEYTFQFLVYHDMQLRQITSPVRWMAENRPQASVSSKLLVQLIIGILITLLVVCLIAFLIYYFCTYVKRKNMKKLAPATRNGLLHGPQTYQTLDSSKHFASPPSGAGSICADIGSGTLHTGPLPTLSIASSINEDNENRRTPGSSCQSTKGFYSPQPFGHLANSAHPLLENTYHTLQNSEMRGSPSNASHVSALTQRILSEVYIAAAKAASMAVSESLASGSMDAVNQTIGGTVTYRPNSHFAESASTMGGSISALDGLNGYPVMAPNGVFRIRKSPNTRTTTPTYQGHLTPQPVPLTPQFTGQQVLRPRISPQTVSSYGLVSPILTPQATMRLNEAANALAAAAAAAVLEATGATPDLGIQGGEVHVSRFSGNAEGGGGEGNGGLGTSSEDGESVSSNSFFPRGPDGKTSSQEASMKRKKLVQGASKGALSNSGIKYLLPMLTISPNMPSNYHQIIDPRGTQTSLAELPAYFPSTPMESMWTQNFHPIENPRTGEEAKFNPHPNAQTEAGSNASTTGVVSIFAKSLNSTVSRRPPAINPQTPSSSASCTTDDSNPDDNTLRANPDMKDLKFPLQPEKPPMPSTESQTAAESQT
uniref:Immunoglobulin n=1 Tax=Echinococcus granulosus TaxID=6210 RepID=A0A068WH68_ECHGR|nr:Immunoglobulin [Echinococcus granulosus]